MMSDVPTRPLFGTTSLRFAVPPHCFADPVVDLLAVDRHVIGRIDPETHLQTAVPEDRHRDVIADPHRLAASPREHQHRFLRVGMAPRRSGRRGVGRIGQ